jgi:16S rRNA (cytosine1402-N4)-methyltransferase
MSEHIPVLLNEVLGFLSPDKGKIILDCTFGFGGHAQAFLGRGAEVIGLDQDADALLRSESRFKGKKIDLIHANFSRLEEVVKRPLDGALFDLGVSSYQIDEPLRGFSIRSDGPLDMRMDKRLERTAADLVNDLSPEELGRIFKEYGEERFAKRIGRAIGRRRETKEVQTTFELKAIIEKAIPTWKKRESVTRIFQALRIAVNSELEHLQEGLEQAIRALKPGGRIVVISYHSLEDRLVKHLFKERAKTGILKVLTKKPMVPKEEEKQFNPRSRSAKLRCAEKI